MSWPVTAQPRQDTTFTADEESPALTFFEKRVAAAVIVMAVRDYASAEPKHASNWMKWAQAHYDAKDFLFSDRGSLPFWCEVAGWDPEWVRSRVRTMKPLPCGFGRGRAF